MGRGSWRDGVSGVMGGRVSGAVAGWDEPHGQKVSQARRLGRWLWEARVVAADGGVQAAQP